MCHKCNAALKTTLALEELGVGWVLKINGRDGKVRLRIVSHTELHYRCLPWAEVLQFRGKHDTGQRWLLMGLLMDAAKGDSYGKQEDPFFFQSLGVGRQNVASLLYMDGATGHPVPGAVAIQSLVVDDQHGRRICPHTVSP